MGSGINDNELNEMNNLISEDKDKKLLIPDKLLKNIVGGQGQITETPKEIQDLEKTENEETKEEPDDKKDPNKGIMLLYGMLPEVEPIKIETDKKGSKGKNNPQN